MSKKLPTLDIDALGACLLGACIVIGFAITAAHYLRANAKVRAAANNDEAIQTEIKRAGAYNKIGWTTGGLGFVSLLSAGLFGRYGEIPLVGFGVLGLVLLAATGPLLAYSEDLMAGLRRRVGR